MATSTWECEAYTTAHRGELVRLWNGVFEGERHFEPMTRATWRDRIERANEGEEFDPDALWVAIDGGRAIGFAHGGLWEGEFLRHLLPENHPERGGHSAVAYLAMIAVDPAHRRRGVGRSLVEHLHRSLADRVGAEIPLLADGRAFNPFYGNFFSPRPVPWGTPEGPAVKRDDAGTVAFFEALGFRRDSAALTVELDLRDRVPQRAPTPQADGVHFEGEIVTEDDYQPILGSSGGNAYPFPNRSRTWVAVDGMEQVGCLIAYPFSDDRCWAIYSLEVQPSHRGRGVGRALLHAGIEELVSRSASHLEALVLPDEAPGAYHLYRSFQFQEVESWWVFG